MFSIGFRHCLDRIHCEVHNHLLELSAIANHLRKCGREIKRNRYVLRLQFVAKEGNSLRDYVAKRQYSRLRRTPYRHHPDACDDIGGAARIFEDT